VAFTFHGLNPITGGVRFTGSIRYLESGIPLVPAIVGSFAIAEMARLFAREGTVITAANAAGDRIAGLRATASHWRTALSCGLIGWAVGVIPGVGGTVANFVAYLNAKETAAEPSSFGQGNIAGVIASEAANDAKDGGSLVPTLALGIPGSASTAVLLGAFLLHGLTPGPLLIAERLDVVLAIVITLVLSNLIASSIGLLGSNVLARLTRVSTDVLVPLVLVTAVFGAFVIRGRLADVVLAAGFGLLGYGMA
jgi:putative tricarboxylic transport membrane protein